MTVIIVVVVVVVKRCRLAISAGREIRGWRGLLLWCLEFDWFLVVSHIAPWRQ